MTLELEAQLTDLVETEFRCYKCKKRTDRYIKFFTLAGIIHDFECLDCRQDRVQDQVDKGWRPASDLLPENLPENR